MRFFLSGELEGDIAEEFINIISEIGNELEGLNSNDYGSEVEEIAIIPIVVNITSEYEDAGFHKERKLFKRKSKEADFRLRIDHETFLSADYATRKILIIRNVIQSIRILGGKAKSDFNAIKLEQDILEVFDIKGVVDELKI
ncbi:MULTISPECIES: Imm44 family immunity protein [Bacillus]|uniref:Dihydrolipoamide succinyltransferase n=1 Tax=Bacillus wiedmannii TaxID=1890302 RepID=A0ABD6TEK1_9BACI|nr:Imm44 family immunity protein [Bacillus wiedmannii]MED2839704.1 Imm44 family immunity protein [Bacillus wiedmannii]OAK01529.1 dihydrolipoamide succinyltransferase [Bacillus wiedmannii]OAK04351.1 dihydrolipoamide succinyltransferase [Bacillus wiedmannii]PEN66851.1 dihydrolipoamide succinyltransferase [Bacillus wiedmannii]PEO58013.1 dihydrolipoamide succinyltransferase [Bacillus wiedmannii]